MTVEEAKKELRSLRYTRGELDVMSEQILRLKLSAEKVTQILSDMPRGGNGKELDEIIARICDLQAAYANKYHALNETVFSVYEALERIDNPTFKSILERRYVLCERWEVIAAKLGYERRWLLKMHGRALCEYCKKRTLKDT